MYSLFIFSFHHTSDFNFNVNIINMVLPFEVKCSKTATIFYVGELFNHKCYIQIVNLILTVIIVIIIITIIIKFEEIDK